MAAPSARRRRFLGASVLGLICSAGPAAALVNVQIGTCVVLVTAPGTLAVSPDLKTLSTSNPGGSPGRVRVSTLINGTIPHTTCSLAVQVNCFHVTIVPPAGFSLVPVGDDGASTLRGGWRPQGGSATLDVLSAVILNGTHDLDLSLTATRTRGTFTAGTYQAEQTIRCE